MYEVVCVYKIRTWKKKKKKVIICNWPIFSRIYLTQDRKCRCHIYTILVRCKLLRVPWIHRKVLKSIIKENKHTKIFLIVESYFSFLQIASLFRGFFFFFFLVEKKVKKLIFQMKIFVNKYIVQYVMRL